MSNSWQSENARRAAAPLSNYDFDFGLGSGFSKGRSGSSGTLNSQKKSSTAATASDSTGFSTQSSSWSYQAPPPSSSVSSATTTTTTGYRYTGSVNSSKLNPSQSAIGDLTGKTWAAAPVSSLGAVGILGGSSAGDTKMFSDLLGGVMASGGPSSSVSNQKKAPTSSTFSVKEMAGSLPSVRGVPLKDLKPKSKSPDLFGEDMGDFVQAVGGGGNGGNNVSASAASVVFDDPFASFVSQKNTHFADTPAPASVVFDGPFAPLESKNKARFDDTSAPAPASASIDPFAASASVPLNLFVDPTNPPSKPISDDPFSFSQTTANSATNKFGSGDNHNDGFSFFQSPQPSVAKANISMPNIDPFEALASSTKPVKAAAAVDPLDNLWSSSTTTTKKASGETMAEMNDWGTGFEFVGGDDGGATTEIEGLPPPPSGVTGSMAKEKGMENYKQGQFADAIKWLSWAVDLLEKVGDSVTLAEVLTCRVSCYKEVGEYKKAVADCTRVLNEDSSNTAVLMLRGLLYESTEKYKLGVADLREVVRKEPQNRVAVNTLARLVKFANA